MLATVIVPLRDDDAFVDRFVESLTSNTPFGSYELIAADRSSASSTLSNARTINAEPESSLATVLKQAAKAAANETLVIAAPNARFMPRWLETLTRPLRDVDSLAVSVPRNDLPTLHAFAIQRDTFLAAGLLDQSVADEMLFETMFENLRQSGGTVLEQSSPVNTEMALRSSNFEVPPNMLGPGVGAAVTELIDTGRAGAKLGEIPVGIAEAIRERLEMEEERRLLLQARDGRDVCWVDEDVAEPLVTIRMATYNRADALMDLALPAALNQTYENIEVVIVGDNTDDATVKAMASVKDPRVRFFNLSMPSLYPSEGRARWLVAGSHPMNLGNQLAQGSWITGADDDDELTVDHVEVLLRAAREQRLEFVWSKSIMDTPDGWQVLGGTPMGHYATTSCAVMWSSPLRFVSQSSTCWKLDEPQDINLHKRLTAIGVRMGFLDHITYRYYPNYVGSMDWGTVQLRCVAVCEHRETVDTAPAKRLGIDAVVSKSDLRSSGIEITSEGTVEEFERRVTKTVEDQTRLALRRGDARVVVYAYEWDTWPDTHKRALVPGLMGGFASAPGPVVTNVFPTLV